MSGAQPVIEINAGSDLNFQIEWPETADTPLDLTDYTVSAFDVSAKLAPVLTLTKDAGTGGTISGRIEWAEGLGDPTREHFQVKITLGTEDRTSPRVFVKVVR